ncbi:MAG: monovalent cation/H(+) antiporter subunit G [Corynebacterium sp.]|nr:monovalent cation/H(+) antiporter subunit G [Corynebacterium sp.]
MILSVFICFLLALGTVNALATTIAIWRAPGPLSRVNIMGTLSTVTFPCFVLAYFLFDLGENGFSLGSLIRMILAIVGVLIAGSAGTFVMGRSIYHTKH